VEATIRCWVRYVHHDYSPVQDIPLSNVAKGGVDPSKLTKHNHIELSRPHVSNPRSTFPRPLHSSLIWLFPFEIGKRTAGLSDMALSVQRATEKKEKEREGRAQARSTGALNQISARAKVRAHRTFCANFCFSLASRREKPYPQPRRRPHSHCNCDAAVQDRTLPCEGGGVLFRSHQLSPNVTHYFGVVSFPHARS
jgi:hypothetical protein